MINSVKESPLMTTLTLTAKEAALLEAIQKGMDEPGCGWLHELGPETKETAGVLGSLVKRGLVFSHKEPPTTPGSPPSYWVELA